MQAHTKISCADTKDRIAKQQQQQQKRQQYAVCANRIAMLIMFVICNRNLSET